MGCHLERKMNQRAELIRNSYNIAALVLLLLLVIFQYYKMARLETLLGVRNAEMDSLRQSDLAQKGQLAEQIEDIKQREQAVEEKTKALNFFAAARSHGQNVFVGLNAGTGLPAFAIDEGRNPELGSFNSALGHGALSTNRTGFLNSAIGSNALGMNADGSNNVAAGANALAWNKSGRANVAVGSAAMHRNVSGTHNSAVGLQALYHLEDGHQNAAFGRDSLFTMKKGSWNSAFGVDSLPGLEAGEGNSAFGGEAGYTELKYNQHRLGSFNSWFGYQSGPATLKQVTNSIAIGYRAKNTDSNQTVIGNTETAETVIHGDVKVRTLCIGSTCADAASFEAMLKATKRNPAATR